MDGLGGVPVRIGDQNGIIPRTLGSTAPKKSTASSTGHLERLRAEFADKGEPRPSSRRNAHAQAPRPGRPDPAPTATSDLHHPLMPMLNLASPGVTDFVLAKKKVRRMGETYADADREWQVVCRGCRKTWELNGISYDPQLKLHTDEGCKPSTAITTFFNASNKPPPPLQLSQDAVCRGFHRPVVKYDKDEFDVTLLHSLQKTAGRDWYGIAEQEFDFAFRGEIINRRGTIKSDACTTFAVGADDRPNGTYMCSACAALDPRTNVGIRRLIKSRAELKQKAGTMATDGKVLNGVNDAHLDRDALVEKLKVRKRQADSLKFTKQRAIATRDARLEAVLQSLANDDVNMTVYWMNTMLRSEDDKQVQVATQFIRGVAESTGRKVADPSGKMSKGMKWSDEVKDVAATLMMTAGPRVTRLMQANLGTPSQRTTTRHRDKLRVPFVLEGGDGGYCRSNFEQLLEVYVPIRTRLVTNGQIAADAVLPVELKTDETPVNTANGPGLVRNRDARGKPYGPDYLVGTCGKKVNCTVQPKKKKKKGEDPGTVPGHHCRIRGGISLDEAGAKAIGLDLNRIDRRYLVWEIMKEVVLNHKMGSYASVTMVRPLHPAFPAMPVRMIATCNQFTARPDVREWTEEEIRQLRDVLEQHGFAFAGWASDGDARRFLLQILGMLFDLPDVEVVGDAVVDVDGDNGGGTPRYDPPLTRRVLKLNTRGFVLQATLMCDPATGRVVYVSGLASQDPLHVLKKLGQMLVRLKPFWIGKTEVTGSHLLELLTTLAGKDHSGLVGAEATITSKSVRLDDRQQVEAHVKNCSRQTIAGLESFREGHGVTVEGTLAWARVMRRYMLLVFSKRSTLTERVEHAGYVASFMTLNFWLNKQNPDRKSFNFCPAQTTRHTIMSCHAIVLLMLVFREACPNVPFCSELSGTDDLERFFANCGGFGNVASHIRDFDYAQLVKMGADMATLRVLFAQGRLKDVPSDKKREWKDDWIEDPKLPLANPTDYPTDEAAAAAWATGRSKAFADTIDVLFGGAENMPECVAALMTKCGADELVDCDIPFDWAENWGNDLKTVHWDDDVVEDGDDGDGVPQWVINASADLPDKAPPPASGSARGTADTADAADTAAAAPATGSGVATAAMRGCLSIAELEKTDQAALILTRTVRKFIARVNDITSKLDDPCEVAFVETCGRCCRTALAAVLRQHFVATGSVTASNRVVEVVVAGKTFELNFGATMTPPGASGRTRGGLADPLLPWVADVYLDAARTIGEIAAHFVESNPDTFSDAVYTGEHDDDLGKLAAYLRDDKAWWGADVHLDIALKALALCNVKVLWVTAETDPFGVFGEGDGGHLRGDIGAAVTLRLALFKQHYWPILPRAVCAASAGAAAESTDPADLDDDAAHLSTTVDAIADAVWSDAAEAPPPPSGRAGDGAASGSAAATAAADDDEYTSAMEVPGTPGLFSKRTVLRLLHEAARGMEGLDLAVKLPRLLKIVETARIASVDVTKAAACAGDMLSMGCNVALAFDDGADGKLYFGHVVKMVTKTSRGKNKVTMKPIALEDVDAGVQIGCEYFTSVAGKEYEFKLGSLHGADDDRKLYELRAVLGLAYFEYNQAADSFTLVDGETQLAKFKTMVSSVVGTSRKRKAGGVSGAAKRHKAPATETQHADYGKRYNTTTGDRAARAKQRGGAAAASAGSAGRSTK
jgi:hypothetical protein